MSLAPPGRLFMFLAFFIGVILISSCYIQVKTKINVFRHLIWKRLEKNENTGDIDGENTVQPTDEGKASDVKSILAKLDRRMPSVTFTDVLTTTSAKSSKATLVSPKDSYCVGEHLLVRLDLFDHLGKRKEYGGDFLRARIYSPGLKAAASGLIKDYGNGTYLANFTLFWEGDVKVSLLLIHPSEAVSALWAARKKGYDKVTFTGKFLNGTSSVLTECGFTMDAKAELCEYVDERDQEAFYCVKPEKVPCAAFLSLKSKNAPISYLTDLERSLLDRSNVGVEIPQTFGNIHVLPCESNKTTVSTKCWAGMRSPFPSGFVWQNQWQPVFCNKNNSNSLEQIYTCLKGKAIYLMGDSTLRQWMENFADRISVLKYLDTHSFGKPQKLIAVDIAGNIQIQWKKHGHPYIGSLEYSVKEHSYVARDIDTVAGEKNTAVVISLGQHFRPFPIEFFIRRTLNVRRAIQRLLHRSPDTRVMIKGENIRELTVDHERLGDLHGYTQYLALKDIFQDLDVAFVDTWDMTIAYDSKFVHPSSHVVWNQINMLVNYLC
ncbi:NXPE family member 4-like isoform X3 [Varanus komodoensis]|nr:NXPE family member 4-like isoform X3 [Varanus komodoensis]XP_044312246.1 NXPE family member 4-like isoform X3 [Varanus komodoensis]XP_044312247.1 NXPE family member 4-like isoform X3 [Varanus komodoensis]